MDLLLTSFSLLVIISVGVMFWSLATQKKDALVINLAGRQRMLTQKMTWLALVQPETPDLAASIKLFDQTLHALRDGGTTIDSAANEVLLPPAPDPVLRAQLDEVAQTWENFRGHLRPVDASALPVEAPLILNQLDAVVSAFEARAEAKHFRLEMILATFLATALVLLGWGFLLTRRKIAIPLAELGAAVQRMGEGNLERSIPAMGHDELGELARAFEAMRADLAASRESLEARVVQRTRELVTAFEFSQEIVAQHELDDLKRSVVDRARSLMQAQSASLCFLMQDGEYLELVANSGEMPVHPGLKQAARCGLAVQLIEAGQTVVAETERTHCRFLLAHTPGLCAAAPLQVWGRTIGALCVVRSEIDAAGEVPLFDPDGQRALTLLANSVAIAITNVRLTKAERYKAEQTAALAEREQLAADLHDNLAQTLSFLRIKLERVEEILAGDHVVEVSEELEHMKTAIEKAFRQVRRALIGLLKPPTATDDFAQELAANLADFQSASGLPAELIIADSSALALPPVTQTQILHIVREALANVRKHALAKRVWVRVERVKGKARFTVEDNGVGFDPETSAGDNHLGLRIMRTRVERTGGELTLASAPGEGTKIVAYFPLHESQKSKVYIA